MDVESCEWEYILRVHQLTEILLVKIEYRENAEGISINLQRFVLK